MSSLSNHPVKRLIITTSFNGRPKSLDIFEEKQAG